MRVALAKEKELRSKDSETTAEMLVRLSTLERKGRDVDDDRKDADDRAQAAAQLVSALETRLAETTGRLQGRVTEAEQLAEGQAARARDLAEEMEKLRQELDDREERLEELTMLLEDHKGRLAEAEDLGASAATRLRLAEGRADEAERRAVAAEQRLEVLQISGKAARSSGTVRAADARLAALPTLLVQAAKALDELEQNERRVTFLRTTATERMRALLRQAESALGGAAAVASAAHDPPTSPGRDDDDPDVEVEILDEGGRP